MEQIEHVILEDVTLSCRITGAGPVVILAHGFPDDATTFRRQVPALVQAGYRVVVPTLRGYAPSGIARSGRYDPITVGGDLVALADRFSPDRPVRLVGHDWGAIAGFAATALAPSRFSHFASLAVPHMRAALRAFSTLAQMRRSWYVLLFQLPRVAEARLSANDFALIDRLWRDWSPGYAASAGELASVKAGIRDRVGPVLAYYRSLPSMLTGASRRLLLSTTRVPTLRMHGAEDGCLGIEAAEGEARCFSAGYAFHRVEGAGHFLQREKPDEVSERLVDFLREQA